MYYFGGAYLIGLHDQIKHWQKVQHFAMPVQLTAIKKICRPKDSNRTLTECIKK